MAAAFAAVRDTASYTGWSWPTDETEHDYLSESPHWSLEKSASGDLGALHLERSDFVQALDTLMTGNLWKDAAFVAERILTTKELKTYVDRHPVPDGAASNDLRARLRYLLGRRLVREDQRKEAARYLPAPYDRVLGKYAEALRKGDDKKRPKADRARALFTAAWLARYDGMELMGTEGAPDGFSEGGSFEVPDLAADWQSGNYRTVKYSGGEAITGKAPIALRVKAPQRRRLAQTKVQPNIRYHYRLVAAALALRAAALLPNESEELADVVNRAGLWVKEADEKLGNRYYQTIERRAAKTKLGRAALTRHWFVDEAGPWSAAEQQAHDAMRKELHFPTDG